VTSRTIPAIGPSNPWDGPKSGEALRLNFLDAKKTSVTVIGRPHVCVDALVQRKQFAPNKRPHDCMNNQKNVRFWYQSCRAQFGVCWAAFLAFLPHDKGTILSPHANNAHQ
jgi:hypothetical protein